MLSQNLFISILESASLPAGVTLQNLDMPKYYLVGIQTIGGDGWKIRDWKVYGENVSPGRRNFCILKEQDKFLDLLELRQMLCIFVSFCLHNYKGQMTEKRER